MIKSMKLIDVQALSKLLNVKPKTIYGWVHMNYIPCLKLGQLLRFDENEVKEWLKSKRRGKSRYKHL